MGGRRLLETGITAETTVIVIHPGSGAQVKCWNSSSWARCADGLDRASASAIRFVLTRSPYERGVLEAIAQRMTAPVTIVTDATMGRLAVLMARARLVLGVDNGPLHLAVAMGTPTIRIFGPTDVRVFGPWGDAREHQVILSTQRCASCQSIPCGRLTFTSEELAQHRCVKRVPEEAVMRTILAMLQGDVSPEREALSEC